MIHTPELVKLFSPADFNEAKSQWAWSNNPVSTRLALRMIAPSQCDVQPKGQGYRRAADGVECKCGLVAGGLDAGEFDGLSEAAANGSEDESGDITFGLEGKVGSLARELGTLVHVQSGFLEEFGGKAHVLSAVNTPEPELFFVALEEMEGFFELLHGAIKGGSQEEYGEGPGVPGVKDADADTVFSGLILINAATVVVANAGRPRW